jgi:hypothetical protein
VLNVVSAAGPQLTEQTGTRHGHRFSLVWTATILPADGKIFHIAR